jgi:hypothetical protein
MMIYFELLKEALSVVIISVLVTIVVYIVLCWLLAKWNKYNIRNLWFILGSIIFIPFMLWELSLFLACSKVDRTLMEPAHTYACSLAHGIDNYSTEAPKAINGVIENFISAKGGKAKKIITNKLSGVFNKAKGGLEIVAAQTDNILNNTIGYATEAATTAVGNTMESLPKNIVAELKEKFPALSIFLTDHGIDGENSEEIIESIFSKINDAIESFKTKRLWALGKFAIVFIPLSVFFGWHKKKRKTECLTEEVQQ